VAQVQDDGFHEIQLNGKQLVFLFMAATVVSVVIFLCGVLVGRSVRAQREALAEAATGTVTEAAAQPAPAPVPPPETKAAPADKFTYPDLGKQKATVEPLKTSTPPDKSSKASSARAAEKASAAEKPAPTPPPVEKVVPEKPAPQRPAATAAGQEATSPGDRATSEPAGQGFAVQIAALNVRSEADAIAKRLTSKGYSAYVLAPPNGTPSVFRVRVGKFSTRREAETVAAKLQKEEQFKPWVTR
jgi:DedD protein